MKKDFQVQKEVFSFTSKIKSFKKYIPFIKGSLSICKIEMEYYEGDFGYRDLSQKKQGCGTGFFIKFKDPNSDNKYKYFLMTCEHVIQKEIINENKIDFTIKYYYEEYTKKFSFNKKQRFIKEYKTNFDLDITIVEIKNNEIPIILFLEPDYDNIKNINSYLNKDIIIHQFPLGLEQCISEGRIKTILNNKKTLVYDSSTEGGSSGSPILLKNQIGIIAVHNGGDENIKKNVADIIIDVIHDVENIKEVDYIQEKDKNEDFENFTFQDVVIVKTDDSRQYTKNPYEILLKKINEKMISISVKNTQNNIIYSSNILYSNLTKTLEKYDYYIYQANINEINPYLFIKFEDMLKLEKKDKNNMNYIIANIKIKKADINKDIQIINSFEQVIRDKQYELNNSDKIFNPNKSYAEVMELTKKYENENEIKNNCEIIINYDKIPFSYKYKFKHEGTYIIKYIFQKKLIKSDYLFYNCKLLTYIDLSNFKTSEIINMESMFDGCNSLQNINLSNINTYNTTTMQGMFNNCKSLESLDLSFFNTEKVSNMGYMFYNCESLKSLDLSFFNTLNVTTMKSMFNYCISLINLDLHNFKTPKLINIDYMFKNCYALKSIDISNFSTSNIINKTEVFTRCDSIDVKNVNTTDSYIINRLSSCEIF